MDNSVKERLIGAAVLAAAVVLIVPALLTGPHEPASPQAPAEGETRRVEIDLAAPGQAVTAPADTPARLPAAEPADASTDSPAGGTALPPAKNEARPPAVEARTSAPAAAAAPLAGQAPGWVVQVAALSSREAASRMVTDLQGRGFGAFVVEYKAEGKLLYRVRVGPPRGRDQAETLAGQLKRAGFKPTVVDSR